MEIGNCNENEREMKLIVYNNRLEYEKCAPELTQKVFAVAHRRGRRA
jgi:hypothetical protein